MNKILNMTYASSLTHLCEVNSSFDTGVLRICYTGQNRNGSCLSKEVIERCLPTIYNCPIVCNYDRDTDTFGGHDMEVVQDDNGGLRIANATSPVGLIPESARVWFEDYEEDDGTIHEYLYADVLLWKRQEAYQKIKRDGVTAHSMEIKVKDGKSVDGVYNINDFEFNAFVLIGETPCFQSSALEMFSHDDFKQKMSEMMRELKETFTMVNTSNEGDNIHSENYSMEGGETVLSEKMELATKYGIDVEALDFALDDFTVEELTEKFEAMKTTEQPAESDAEDQETDTFALVENIVSEICRVLSAEKFVDKWGDEISHYLYVDCDFEAREVYCWDTCDWLLYGFAYTMNGDSITIDYASKKRKKFIIADFEGDEQAHPMAPMFELVETKLADYEDVKEKFSNASEQIAAMETELTELRQFKANVDSAEMQSKREKVFAKFEDLAGVESYEALKENCADYDLDTLEEKCFAIRGRNATTLKFSMDAKAPKLMVERTANSDEPYGGLFEKYAHGSN